MMSKLGIVRNDRSETINVAVVDIGQSRLEPDLLELPVR